MAKNRKKKNRQLTNNNKKYLERRRVTPGIVGVRAEHGEYDLERIPAEAVLHLRGAVALRLQWPLALVVGDLREVQQELAGGGG